MIGHPACAAHDPGPPYPDVPERLEAIGDQMIAAGVDAVVRPYDAPCVSREALLRAHDEAYVDALFDAAPETGTIYLDEDTPMMPGSLPAALHAAGAATMAVDLVMSGEAHSAFCAVRPPGHHAERGKAMGFCFFNNVAVGALHALEIHHPSRLAVLDFDVHHGNGTEDILGGNERVLFCSSFQHPCYPFTGHESASEHVVNVPLPAGTDGPAFRAAIERAWLPALERFRPELILLSAGFDGHALDPMADLALLETDYAWLTEIIRSVAGRHASGRIVSVLEGGYHLGALARSTVAHVKALL